MRPHARTTANPTEINAGERISRGAKQVHKKRKQELPHDERESFTDLAQRKRKRIKNEPIVCVCIAYQEGLMQKGQIELCLQTMESISCCLHDHKLQKIVKTHFHLICFFDSCLMVLQVFGGSTGLQKSYRCCNGLALQNIKKRIVRTCFQFLDTRIHLADFPLCPPSHPNFLFGTSEP